MNDGNDNNLPDDFDIDKILAEVKAMNAAGNAYAQADEPVAQEPVPAESTSAGTNPLPDSIFDDLYAQESTPSDNAEPEPGEPEVSAESGEPEEPEAAGESEDSEETASRPFLVLLNDEKPVSVEETLPEQSPGFNNNPDQPWWESPEAEEIFGPRKVVSPPEELIIEPVEETQTNSQPDDSAGFFVDFQAVSAAPEEPQAPDPGVYTGGMETDEARERFLKDLILEKTAEHDMSGPNDPIEKPGVIVEKGVSSKTSDLETMPTVLPAEEVLRAAQLAEEKTRISGAMPGPGPADKKDILDGQIILRGFENKEAETEKVSELSVEEALLAARREKAKKFIKIVGIPGEEEEAAEKELFKGYEQLEREPEEESGGDASAPREKKSFEYRFPEQRNRIFSAIHSAGKRAAAGTIALTVIELVCLALVMLPKLLDSAAVDSPLFAADGNAFLLLHLILLSLAAFFGMACILSGFKALLRLKPNCDTGAALAVSVCAVQLILAVFMKAPDGSAVPVYSAAAVFALLLNSAAKRISHACALDNFRFCAFDWPRELHSVSGVDDANEAFELGRGILMGNPAVVYSSKIGFPADFVANARDVGLAERFCGIIVPAASGAAVLAGVIAGLFTKSFLSGFSVLTAAMCLGVPAGALLGSAYPLRAANKLLNDGGAMIVNQDAADELAKSNAVAVDSADIFDRSRCDMHGMKEFKNFRIDDVILYAAAMIIKSGGPLTDVFDKVIVGHRELLPPVKSFSYEDRQGISALIHGQNVLLGNRTFLVNHSIDVPNKSDEDKYKHDGRRIMYLAIANKIAAMFVVSYAADDSLLPYLKILENNGIQLLVRTCDANVTEDLLADCFNLPVTNIKVVSATAGRLFKRLRESVRDTAPARVLHNGTALTLVKSIAAANGVSFGIRAAQIVQTVGVGLGLLGLIVLAALSAAGSAGALQIVLFQAFWTAAALAAGSLKRIK